MNTKEKARIRKQKSRESKSHWQEEKDVASEQLRGKHTMAQRKEARTANSFKKRLANAATRSANNQYYGRQQSLKLTLEFLFATTEVHKYNPDDTSNLDPISVDEIQTCVTEY